ncbi:Hypothetical predicted protein [Podarcis lilfordi]|uniref:Uncharacterized protein n=1 Tax=Podarcis lilfordi TaxID=74358 RepID=A0AA35PL27_9SAUR|nr:Hypothetical predicted protein [Podarcis lilfordi]
MEVTCTQLLIVRRKSSDLTECTSVMFVYGTLTSARYRKQPLSIPSKHLHVMTPNPYVLNFWSSILALLAHDNGNNILVGWTLMQTVTQSHTHFTINYFREVPSTKNALHPAP